MFIAEKCLDHSKSCKVMIGLHGEECLNEEVQQQCRRSCDLCKGKRSSFKENVFVVTREVVTVIVLRALPRTFFSCRPQSPLLLHVCVFLCFLFTSRNILFHLLYCKRQNNCHTLGRLNVSNTIFANMSPCNVVIKPIDFNSS